PAAAIMCPATTPLAAPMAPPAPAALSTGCLMMADDTAAVPRLIILSPPALASPAAAGATAFGVDLRIADKPGPTPGISPTALLARPPRKEKKPGSPRVPR